MLNMKPVQEVSLSKNSKFKFRCHKGLSCFNKCCSNIDIMLPPYDIIRLKKRLGISSGEFLQNYTYTHIDEKTSYPFVFLKMSQEKKGACPFLQESGCSIYTDRPAACRYYPIGQASLKKLDEALNKPVTEEFYFIVKEDHCLGFNEDKEWTIAEWRRDQEADLHDDMNRGWKEILFCKDMPQSAMDDKKQKAFYMACYDTDRFRSFVFDSRFLDLFDVDGATLQKMQTDDVELMKFGVDYAKYILMIEQTLKMKG